MSDKTAEPAASKTLIERPTDVDVVASRTFNAPARIVWKAWTTPELFMRWWAPRSMGMVLAGCEMDVREGGKYRVKFGDPSADWAFFGKYLEVVPHARLVWTNDEDDNDAITTVTFEETGGCTRVTYRETYPTKQALDEAGGAVDAAPEQFDQLAELLAGLGEGVA